MTVLADLRIAETEFTSGDTAHVASIPAGPAGDVLFAIAAFASSEAQITVATPSGWTLITAGTNTDSLAVGYRWYRKISDGSEATVALTSTESDVTGVTQVIRVPKSKLGAASVVGGGANDTSAAPNPSPAAIKDSVTPNIGRCIFIVPVAHGVAGTLATATGLPLGYDLIAHTRQSAGTNRAGLITVIAVKGHTGSEDPSAFTLSASEQWATRTVAFEHTITKAGRRRFVEKDGRYLEVYTDGEAAKMLERPPEPVEQTGLRQTWSGPLPRTEIHIPKLDQKPLRLPTNYGLNRLARYGSKT